MRVAQHSDVPPTDDLHREISAHIHGISRYSKEQSSVYLLATVTVGAYIAGILLEKIFAPGFLAGEAKYLIDASSYSVYFSVILRMQITALFQLTIILFLGLHLLGSTLVISFCTLYGSLLGLCVAGVACYGGKMLIWFWLINGTYVICHSINILWLCAIAKRSGNYLFCKVLNRNSPQNSTHPSYRLRYAFIRYILSLLFSILYSVVGAFIAILFSKVLL